VTPLTQLSLIRPEEVAKILGCSVVYIYKLAQRGELPSYAFGRADLTGSRSHIPVLAPPAASAASGAASELESPIYILSDGFSLASPCSQGKCNRYPEPERSLLQWLVSRRYTR
jgi:excisionase family DNA binding protein